MVSVNVAGVLQDARDADARPAADPTFKLNSSSFLTVSHLLHCIVLPGMACPLYCYYKRRWNGIDWGRGG